MQDLKTSIVPVPVLEVFVASFHSLITSIVTLESLITSLGNLHRTIVSIVSIRIQAFTFYSRIVSLPFFHSIID